MTDEKKDARPDWSESERDRLTELLKQSDHRRWLVDLLKRWALWITAVLAGARYAWDGLKELLAFLLKDTQ